MPLSGKNGNKALDKLLERIYNKALLTSDGDKTQASKVAWRAVRDAGWFKDPKSEKWKKKRSKNYRDVTNIKR